MSIKINSVFRVSEDRPSPSSSGRLRVCSESSSRREFAAQFALAQDVLRIDPYRVGLPGIVLGARYIEVPLPIPSEFWILEDSHGKILGRVGANLSPVFPNTGYLGFFEACDFQSAKTLIHAAFGWLEQRGVKTIYGPVNINTWLSYRFRVEPEDSFSLSCEPVQPPSYPLWFREMGFQVAEGYHSLGLESNQGMLEKYERPYRNAVALGYSFRIAGASGPIEPELRTIFEISMASFRENFLFEPLPYELFAQLYVPQVQKSASNTVHFLCNGEGKEIGYISTFIEGTSLVLKTIALLPEARGLRLSNTFFYPALMHGAEKGATRPVMALIRDGIVSEAYGKGQKVEWKHRYELYKKELL